MLKLGYLVAITVAWFGTVVSVYTDEVDQIVRSNERNETICFGQTEPITCAQGEFIFVQYAGYGYSNNTPSNSDTSWCEDPELTCADSRAASRLYGFSSSQGIPDIQVPDGNVSCDGMTQDYNYVHVRYYCIPSNALQGKDICSNDAWQANVSSLMSANFPEAYNGSGDCTCKVRTVSGESTHMTVSWHIVDLPAENCGERLRAGTNGRDDDVLDECSPHVGGLASTSSSFVKSADVTFNRRDGLTGEAKVWLDIGGGGELLQFQCNDAITEDDDVVTSTTADAATTDGSGDDNSTPNRTPVPALVLVLSAVAVLLLMF